MQRGEDQEQRDQAHRAHVDVSRVFVGAGQNHVDEQESRGYAELLELDALRRRGQLQAAGRAYDVNDLPMLESVGISAGYLSVLVLALYINSPATLPLYKHPKALWPLCVLLLYWITRT